MSLNETPSGERIHIAFFGLRNAGKSSLVNAVTAQETSLVSKVKGTTTDPVRKSMELLPLGPVLIIDTPGLDDEGELGDKRAERARRVLAETDIAVLVSEAGSPLSALESDLVDIFREKRIPFCIAWTKADLAEPLPGGDADIKALAVSAKTGLNIKEFKELLASVVPEKGEEKHIVADLVNTGDIVILVIPIDESAPKGRLILPQQQVIRELLEKGCRILCCQPEELKGSFDMLSVKPGLVITDSQAFEEVAKDTPEDIRLTSFSILFARYKGELSELKKGADKLSHLKSGDKVLICEGCTHHRQCNDIGTVKLPGWIKKFSGVSPEFSFTSGKGFPEDLSEYALIVHCGGCMLNEAEMKNRIRMAREAGIPIVNYGIAIACMKGILNRSLI